MEQHTKSLKQFYKVLENDPDNIKALLGAAVGFANLGEYSESLKYLEKANRLNPNNTVIQNYNDIIEKTIKKNKTIISEKNLSKHKLKIYKVVEKKFVKVN